MKNKLYMLVGIIFLAPFILSSQEGDKEWQLKFYKNNEPTKVMDVDKIDSISFPSPDGPPSCNIMTNIKTINRDMIGENKFIVTVQYSEEMSENRNPKIVFKPAIKDLPEPTGAWDEPHMVYTFTYNVTDQFESDAKDVTITVSDAIDMTGNSQTPCALEKAFTIDLKPPKVTRISVFDMYWITDNLAGKQYKVEITFDEEMDASPGRAPEISYSATMENQTFINKQGEWNAAHTKYTFTYKIADANIDQRGITIYVDKAKDVSLNSQNKDSLGTHINVDTKNPTITAFSANLTNIDQNTVGLDKFKINLTFSENMKPDGPKPSLAFSPSVSNTLTLKSEGWEPGNSKKYTLTYDVRKSDDDFQNGDITVKKAHDENGNEMVAYQKIDYINVGMKNVVVFDDHFNYPPTIPPDQNWSIDSIVGVPEADQQIQTAYRMSDSTALVMHGNIATAPPSFAIITRDMGPLDSIPGVVEMEGYMMAHALTDSGGIAFVNNTNFTKTFAKFSFTRYGKFSYSIGTTTGVVPKDYVAYEWYKVRMKYDQYQKTLSVWLNDALVVDNQVGTGFDATGYNRLGLFCNDGLVYFDDMKLWFK